MSDGNGKNFLGFNFLLNKHFFLFRIITQKEIKNGFSDLIISDIKNGKLSASKVESKYYGSEKFYYIKLKGVKFAFFVVYRHLNKNLIMPEQRAIYARGELANIEKNKELELFQEENNKC